MATSIMAARDGRWTPIASTPTRDNADVNSIAFIKAFFEDFPGSIATRAADYTNLREQRLRFERVAERDPHCRTSGKVEDS